jgi:light-regulated signal transduction histidine kinase (bacteriophytochrome)
MNPPLDLTACAREPIHQPGCVQSHGLLLVLAVLRTQWCRAGGGPDGDLGRGPQQTGLLRAWPGTDQSAKIVRSMEADG